MPGGCACPRSTSGRTATAIPPAVECIMPRSPNGVGRRASNCAAWASAGCRGVRAGASVSACRWWWPPSPPLSCALCRRAGRRGMLASGFLALELPPWHERVRGHGGLAHGALPPRRAHGAGFGVGAQPLVDAGPAVEVAAERDHRLRGALEADVAVEAAKARLRRRRRRGRVCADDPLRRFLAGSPPWAAHRHRPCASAPCTSS